MNTYLTMTGIKILIVEDEVITGMYLETMLKKSGYNVVNRVGTGEGAIRDAKTHCPHYILMDVRLAGKMDGLETAKEILSFCDTHIIFMTGYQIDGIKQQTLDIKSCSYVVKPVDIHKLISEINNTISLK
jgi:two-component system, response regulator PdtaR